MSDMMSFEEFSADWQTKHRAQVPDKKRVTSYQVWFWIAFWVIVAVAAALFSGVHTIPAARLTIFADVAGRDWLAVTAFIIVELVIFGAAAGRREIPRLVWLMGAALTVALVGNISSSVTAVAQNHGDILNQIGGVLLSIIAPFTALAAGEVVHIQLDKRAENVNANDSDYLARWQAMEVKINRAYTQYENGLKAREIELNGLNLIKFNQISPRNKQSPKLKKALDWLEANPGNLDTPPRELEPQIGISYGTIFTAQKMLKTAKLNGGGLAPDASETFQ